MGNPKEAGGAVEKHSFAGPRRRRGEDQHATPVLRCCPEEYLAGIVQDSSNEAGDAGDRTHAWYCRSGPGHKMHCAPRIHVQSGIAIFQSSVETHLATL